MEHSLSIMSLNCRGLNDKIKQWDIFKRLRERNIKIACLQNIHKNGRLCQSRIGTWSNNMPLYFQFRFVAILFNRNLEYETHRYKYNGNGNCIVIDRTLENHIRFTLVNLYSPNEDNPNFYKNMNKIKNGFENDGLLICGDWNLIIPPLPKMHLTIDIKIIPKPAVKF